MGSGNQKKIDAGFLRNVQEHCNGGLEWAERQDIERLALVEVAAETAEIAAKEDVGLASYGVAMFKLGYEVRRAQEQARHKENYERITVKSVESMDEAEGQGHR